MLNLHLVQAYGSVCFSRASALRALAVATALLCLAESADKPIALHGARRCPFSGGQKKQPAAPFRSFTHPSVEARGFNAGCHVFDAEALA